MTGRKIPCLRIDARNDRICIHRTTLKALESPEFIILGILPEQGKLMVAAQENRYGGAIRVDYRCGDCFCIRSKFFMESIRSCMSRIKAEGSYLLEGRKLPEKPAVLFDIKEIPSDENRGEI